MIARVLAGLLALSVVTPAAAVSAATSETLPLNSQLQVRVVRGSDLEIEIPVAAGDTYASLATEFSGAATYAEAIAAWNGGHPIEELAAVRIPFALVADDHRLMVLVNLFPDDRFEDDHWIHRARSGRLAVYSEGMWQVAEWFTGQGERFAELMAINGLDSPELRRGQEIRIPVALLHPALRPGERSADGSLVYGTDSDGPYAGYRLRPGEALYSAVVARYTGRTSADDVVQLATQIAGRSGIDDMRDIPVGYLVKIPFDLLEPEFLPAGHPRRREAEQEQARLAEALAAKPVPGATGLAGVVVLLDPGHGGKDLGTMNHDIWEHDYVYDVTCRLKRILEQQSAARVVLTLEDKESGCTPSNREPLKKNLQGTVLTTPPFLAKQNGEARIGVNLRWYLANSVYRRETRGGTDADRIVFVSLHADARHPSLRGAMVYVPGARYRTKTYGHSGPPYDRYAEVREKPLVRFSYKNRIRSEAVSRKLAAAILDGFRSERLAVPTKSNPVRDRVIRGRRQYVPAVIRNNEIPAKVLVEMVNLSNRDDAAVLATATDRERLARALARGLFDHFGEKLPASLASREPGSP